jgi:periplasmic divalent cation tolerance protein
MRKKTARVSLILSTCPNSRVAKRIANALVREKLAACVSIVPALHSIYRWKGKVESAREVLLIIKARTADYSRIEARLQGLHPYELPEIISVGITGGSRRYLHWVEDPDQVQ